MDHIVTDIGSRLQQAREQRGLTLRDIATTTKISMTALTAIERNDFARLPGGLFARAYVRAFAAEVGLNADEFAREYRATFETEPAGPPLPHKADSNERSRLPLRLAVVSAIIVAILIGGSLILGRGDPPQNVPDERGMPSAGAPGLPGHPAQGDDSDDPEEIAFAPETVADIRAPSLRLEIRTNGPCWVSAAADGERVIYRLMQPGEQAQVDARTEITLRVGDAGSVAYSINGATGRPLGANGEVVTLRITKDTLGSFSNDPARPTPIKGAVTS